MVSMFFLIWSSTILVTSRRSRLALMTIFSTGDASVASFSTTGVRASRGSCPSTVLTLSRTSCAATSGSFSSTKPIVMIDTPSAEVEFSSSMPEIVFTASSSTLVTCDSTSSGDAPGSTVVIET